MIITLTPAQWKALCPLVVQGRRAQVKLGLPLDLDNGDQRIIIEEDEVRIQLED